MYFFYLAMISSLFILKFHFTQKIMVSVIMDLDGAYKGILIDIIEDGMLMSFYFGNFCIIIKKYH